jgi:hypothetical protein
MAKFESGGLSRGWHSALAGEQQLGHFAEERAQRQFRHRTERRAMQRRRQGASEIGVGYRAGRHTIQ